eukprot:9476138-Heterocapsa_arctica.AAC.1
MEIQGTLRDVLKKGEHLINGLVPFVVLEREPSKQARFQAVGRSLDGLKKAVEQKGDNQWSVAPDWPTFSLFLESADSIEKTKVLVVQEDGAFVWNEKNLRDALGMSPEDVMCLARAR